MNEEIKKDNCPKCNYEYKTGESVCQKCGIIFEKYAALQKKQIAKKQSLMTKCNVCDKQLSKNATFCPHCGEPNKTENAMNPSKEKVNNSLSKDLLKEMIQCDKCGVSFDKTIKKCPKCNHPNIKANYSSPSLILICLIVSIGILWLMLTGNSSGKLMLYIWLLSWCVISALIGFNTKSKVTIVGGGFIASLIVIMVIASITGQTKTKVDNTPQISDHMEAKDKTQRSAEEKKMVGQVHINAEASTTPDERIMVKGVTNLPDQTELLITVSNVASGFSAQDKPKVLNGTFSAGPFGTKFAVSPGNYFVEIIMPISNTQPEIVQMAIGKKGEYLTGPFVKDSLWEWAGKIVEYSFSYTVGSQQQIKQAESKYCMLVSDVRQTTEKLLKYGRLMERYRNTDEITALRTCGTMMRQNQSEAKMLREKAEALPLDYLDLKVAAIEISSCVSCSKTAIESCNRVDDLLKK